MVKIDLTRIKKKIILMRDNNPNWRLLVLLGLMFNIGFNLFISLGDLFNFLSFAFAYWIGSLMGFTPEQLERVMRFFELAGTSSDVKQTSEVGGFMVKDYVDSLINMVFIPARSLFSFLSFNFPILLDIKWDLDWVHVDFSYWLRTALNLGQFAIMFMLTWRFKSYIRKKIRNQDSEQNGNRHDN